MEMEQWFLVLQWELVSAVVNIRLKLFFKSGKATCTIKNGRPGSVVRSMAHQDVIEE